MLKLRNLLEFNFLKYYFSVKCKNDRLLTNAKKGFTLAEVLITLLIIGIVASIVIPALISDTQDAEFKVAGKKAFSEMSNVIKQMKQDKGTLNGYIGNGGSFKPDFIKYFNVIKDCGNSSCVAAVEPSPIYKSLTGEQAIGWMGGEGQFITNDGMFINIQNSDLLSRIMLVVDVNGYKKPPNVYGKDTYIFELINDNLLPEGAPGTDYTAAYCNKSTPSGYQGFGCAVYMLQNKEY